MVIGVVLLVIGFLALLVGISTVVHLQHEGKKIKLILLAVLLLFFILSFLYVVSKNQISLKSADGVISSGKAYAGWAGHAVKNIFTTSKQTVIGLKKSVE